MKIRDTQILGANGMPAVLDRQEQSADQLATIMRASFEGIGDQLSVTLSEANARKYYHGWQYACCSLLSEAVMQIPWHVQTRKGDDWEDQEDHPLAQLLRAVNPILTGEELWYYTMLDLLMVGKSWWYMPDNALSEPGEIYPLSGTIKPVLEKAGGTQIVKAWKQVRYDGDKGRREETYDAAEIAYLRFPKPGNMLDGIGPTQAAGAQIRLDAQITEAEWAVMKNGVWPSVLLKIPGRTPAERDQVLAEFDERYVGAKKTGKPIATSENVGVEWPPIKPREMGFERGAARMRDMILAVYRVPRAMLGLSEGLPRANVEGMHYVFAKWSVAPKVVLLESRANQDLVHRRYGEDTRLKFDDPVPADKEFTLRESESGLKNYAITINEYRAERGLEPVAWGDVPLAPMTIAPLGTPPLAAAAAAPGGQGQATPTAGQVASAILQQLNEEHVHA